MTAIRTVNCCVRVLTV